MTINLASMTTPALRRAIQIKESIESLTRELASLTTGSGARSTATKFGGRPKMSAAARAKISAAVKARWAKAKKGTSSAKSAPAKAAPVKKKRAMSPAAKAKLSAIAKARWAKLKAAGKNSM